MIELKDVSKNYGRTTAIDRLDLSIAGSGIYCLLGRNGAGKTTLMKLLAGHIAASDGRIMVAGEVISPGHMSEKVNYVESGSPQLNMRIGELIEAACGLQENFDKDFALRMTERFKLNERKRYKQLSFGMKTMLTTIITLANTGEVLLLDEPTLGFDAIMREQFNNLLMESYAAHPRLIIVSTHLIDEFAKVTERFIIIDQGRILLEAHMDDMDEKAYTLSGHVKAVEPLLSGLNVIGKTQAGSVMAAHVYDRRVDVPEGVAIERMGLQDFFVKLVG